MMFSRQLLLLCFLGLLLLPSGAQLTTSRELYVKPTEDTPCPEPCHTLDEYVQNVTQYFVSNTTFNFLPGNHSLSQPLNVSGVTNLAMVAINGLGDIVCYDNSSLYFKEISNLTLENMTLFLCNSLLLNDLLNLTLLRVSIRGTNSCLHTTNILGTSIVTVFGTPLSECSSNVHYSDDTVWLPPTRNQLTVQDSVLSSTLEVQFHQFIYSVNLVIDNFTNTASRMTDMFFFHLNSMTPTNISLTNLHVVDHVGYAPADIQWFNSANAKAFHTSVYIGNCHTSYLAFVFASTKSMQVLIENSRFEHVSGVAFSAFDLGKSTFLLRNVTFYNVQQNPFCDQYVFHVPIGFISLGNVKQFVFSDCKFYNSKAGRCMVGGPGGVVQLCHSNNVTFTNCTFRNNEDTPIVSVDSTFTLSGSNTFHNNTAYQGGAMALYGHSYVTLANDSKIQFVNNSAENVGGAIHIDKYYGVNTPCFFQCQSECAFHSTSALQVSLLFDNNQAENGGDSIYGASFDRCIVDPFAGGAQGWMFLSSLFHIDQRSGSILSAVSSDPLRVCLCDTQNDSSLCTTIFKNRTVYPGEMFPISAVVVGDRFGTVDGSVYAQLLPLDSHAKVAELGPLQRSQRVEHDNCNNISYTVLSNSSAVCLVLTASSRLIQQYPTTGAIMEVEDDIDDFKQSGKIGYFLGSFPIYINITLLPCPLGFMLSDEPYQCICDTQLQNNHIPCNLTTQTVQRSGTEWVNASFHNNTSNGVIMNKYCPNNYCKPEKVNISLEHPDIQCAFNHSGILCGGCQSGLSLALGSAQCLSCSNDYLALIIPFALAGFALVFFIKLLNLTVAKGTLNGLIFYANIVRANQVAWIPGHDTNILTVFIAWINLDLGIETCFFNGLDAYWKTWLQFVFPLYIWAIMILIILLSRYSSTAANIFGSNSVPVLATLFLLSYSKLLRTIISIFQASTLDYPDETSATMWSYDGNIPYFSPKRIPLLLVALMVLLFLFVPYTGVLLFSQCLQRSNYRVAALLVRFKPFFDAYFGPLKDKHQYWVGLLLLVRGALFVVYAATPTSMAGIGLLATAVAMPSLLVYPPVGYVYRKSYLNLLESSFLLNLCILAVGTFYIQNTGGDQAALAYTSAGIAFALFLVIVSFHAMATLRSTRWATSLANRYFVKNPQQVNQDQRDYERIPEEPEANQPGEHVHMLRLTWDNYREPVLKYLDD